MLVIHKYDGTLTACGTTAPQISTSYNHHTTCPRCRESLGLEAFPKQKCSCRTNSDLRGFEHEDGCSINGVRFRITQDIKMLRETLCIAQWEVNHTLGNAAKKYQSEALQQLINECDRHRPLASNGTHGNLHTDTCGCAEKGPRELWGSLTPKLEELVHGVIRGTTAPLCWTSDKKLDHPIRFTGNPAYITCPDCQMTFSTHK